MSGILLTHNAALIIRGLKSMPERMGREIALAQDEQNQLTIGYAQSKHLSGPRPDELGVVTNRLRLSLNASPAVASGNTVTSAIGTNVKYAAVHEFGFDGEVQVEAHERRRLSQTTSRFEVNISTGSIRKRTGRAKRATLGVTTVRAHSRHMKMPARPFISNSVDERRGDYGQAISSAILTAWNQQNS
jgi:phage gpG-like protein